MLALQLWSLIARSPSGKAPDLVPAFGGSNPPRAVYLSLDYFLADIGANYQHCISNLWFIMKLI